MKGIRAPDTPGMGFAPETGKPLKAICEQGSNLRADAAPFSTSDLRDGLQF